MGSNVSRERNCCLLSLCIGTTLPACLQAELRGSRQPLVGAAKTLLSLWPSLEYCMLIIVGDVFLFYGGNSYLSAILSHLRSSEDGTAAM